MTYTDINHHEIARRKRRLLDEYGDVPVERSVREVPPEQFAREVEFSREGYLGGAYVWVVRTPE